MHSKSFQVIILFAQFSAPHITAVFPYIPAHSPQDSVTNLRTFQMAKNCLIAAGCHQVARIVARSPLLEDLKVSGTRVPSVGTLALVRTLQANVSLRLRRLDLSDNSFEAADSYEALAVLLASPQVLNAV
jgi:hypothetical protein